MNQRVVKSNVDCHQGGRPDSPPSRLWSLPITAFWTTFDSREMTTKSRRVQPRQTSLASKAEEHDDDGVDQHRSQDFLSNRNLYSEHRVPHTNSPVLPGGRRTDGRLRDATDASFVLIAVFPAQRFNGRHIRVSACRQCVSASGSGIIDRHVPDPGRSPDAATRSPVPQGRA